jgi:GntR family transcriptional repressor for pyruvate dehydrogenase complex
VNQPGTDERAGVSAAKAGQRKRPKGRGADRAIIDRLIEMIESAGLGVGDRLPPEIELARRLDVGRSTVREALKAWQGMGIVVRNKGAGTTLAAEVSSNSIHLPLTLMLEAESLLRTHAVRRPLEIEAVRLAALNASGQQRRVIHARMAELLAVCVAGEDWRPADNRFHAAIYDTSGNPLFGQLIVQIQKAFHDIYDAPFGKPYLGEITIPLHKSLSDFIVAGAADDAGRCSAEIMGMVEAEVRGFVEAGNA